MVRTSTKNGKKNIEHIHAYGYLYTDHFLMATTKVGGAVAGGVISPVTPIFAKMVVSHRAHNFIWERAHEPLFVVTTLPPFAFLVPSQCLIFILRVN